MDDNYIKKSIFLPNTDFSMKANLPEKEKFFSDYWYDINLYEKHKNLRKGKQKFTIHLGPPYANGQLHIGHGLNSILKDTIIRFHRDCQIDAVNGHDCHGLPIELATIKQEKFFDKDKFEDINFIKEFCKKCKEFASNWIDIQSKTFRRLGFFIDQHKKYKTMEHQLDIRKIFSKILLNKYVYVEGKPTPWSITEGSSISDSEIEYKNKKSKSIYVSLPIISNHKFLSNTKLIIWTTTPWTLLDNEAVCFDEKQEYVIIETETKGNFVISKSCVDNFTRDVTSPIKIIKTFLGEEFKNLECYHPIKSDKIVPLLSGEVLVGEGTGFIHIAPAHGIEDYNLWKQYFGHKQFTESVNKFGYYEKNTLFEGLHIFENEEDILNKVGDKLLSLKEIEHSYPYCERSLKPTPVIYRSTLQVFININDWKKNISKYALDINWLPNDIRNNVICAFSTRQEWCVSRQRFWGVPLSIFINKDTNEVVINKDLEAKVIEILEKTPEYFLSPNCKEILKDYVDNIDNYEAIIGVLDVWFDSGCTFTFREETLNSDVICEGKDQLRGWFQSLLINSQLADYEVPMKTIFTHGFVLDQEGKKMSKSLGNVIQLEDILNDYGSEIYRILIYTSDYYDDIRIGKNILTEKVDMYRKIRNVMRFLISVTEDISEVEKTFNQHDFLEMYIFEKLSKLVENFHLYRSNINLKAAFEEIFAFIQELSSFYLTIRKDTLYCGHISSRERMSCRNACYILLKTLTNLLSAFLPFTTEEVYSHCKDKNNSFGRLDSIHLEDWINVKDIPQYSGYVSEFDKYYDFFSEIRIKIENARKEGHIKTDGQVFMFIPKGIIVETNKNEFKLTLEHLTTILGVAYIEERGKEVLVDISPREKCARCWMYRGNLCNRCETVLRSSEGLQEL